MMTHLQFGNLEWSNSIIFDLQAQVLLLEANASIPPFSSALFSYKVQDWKKVNIFPLEHFLIFIFL